MNFFQIMYSDKRGMAMVIVLTACFVVLATVSVGAVLIANNLDKAGAGFGREKAASNAQSGLERARGMWEANGSVFDGCSADDCINTTDGGCGICSEVVYNVGDNRHRVLVSDVAFPSIGEDPHAGAMTLRSTGYYRNISHERSSVLCLDYCTVGGYNCGNDGCGGQCGTCSLGQTCEAGVCSGGATACDNAAVECGDECSEGNPCGGGTVIDSTNNVVAVLGGCEDEFGNNCGNQADMLTKTWDNTGGHYIQTDAIDSNDGRNNTTTLQGIEPALDRFDAVRFCDELVFNGFANWYLPGSKEGDTMVQANTNNWMSNTSTGCYWMSNEENSDNAAYKNFDLFGACSDGNKSNNYYVRCLRRY